MTEEANTVGVGSWWGAKRRRLRVAIAGCLALAGLLALAAPAAASNVSVEDTELEIDGDADSDLLTVSSNGTTITVRDTGTGGVVTGDPDCTQVNPTTVTCPATLPGESPIDHFEVDLDDGNDSFTNENLVTPFGHVHSQSGLGGPASGVKTINGGPGGQLLEGGLASDVIHGGEGDDELDDGGGSEDGTDTGGNDLLDGGPGTDSVFYFRTTDLRITVDNAANDGQTGEADNILAENITTGSGNDVVVGDNSANVFVAGGGADSLTGAGGNDELYGDTPVSGGILVRGGPFGISGNDTLDGGDGRDLLDCGPAFDVALHEPLDEVKANCERTGAEVVGDSAQLTGKKKNKFKAELLCPESEGEPCTGELKVRAAGKKIGKGKFSIGAGKTHGANAKLSKKGVKAVKRAGGALLVTVEATTNEPGGKSVDEGTILVHR